MEKLSPIFTHLNFAVNPWPSRIIKFMKKFRIMLKNAIPEILSTLKTRFWGLQFDRAQPLSALHGAIVDGRIGGLGEASFSLCEFRSNLLNSYMFWVIPKIKHASFLGRRQTIALATRIYAVSLCPDKGIWVKVVEHRHFSLDTVFSLKKNKGNWAKKYAVSLCPDKGI